MAVAGLEGGGDGWSDLGRALCGPEGQLAAGLGLVVIALVFQRIRAAARPR